MIAFLLNVVSGKWPFKNSAVAWSTCWKAGQLSSALWNIVILKISGREGKLKGENISPTYFCFYVSTYFGLCLYRFLSAPWYHSSYRFNRVEKFDCCQGTHRRLDNRMTLHNNGWMIKGMRSKKRRAFQVILIVPLPFEVQCSVILKWNFQVSQHLYAS